MRIVADTNIAVSGLLWHGNPRKVLEGARSGTLDLFGSSALLVELSDVLSRPNFAERIAAMGTTAADLALGYAALIEQIEPTIVEAVVAADPDDDAVLACAAAANAEAIVSGDGHLLNLGRYRGIEIVTAAALCQRLGL